MRRRCRLGPAIHHAGRPLRPVKGCGPCSRAVCLRYTLADSSLLSLDSGIPVLLEAYLAFRQKLRSLDPKPTPDQTPQLVIAGHGSVDDVRWLVPTEAGRDIV